MTAGNPTLTLASPDQRPPILRGWRAAGYLALAVSLLTAGLAFFWPAHETLDAQGQVHSCTTNGPDLLLLLCQVGALALLAYIVTLPFTRQPVRSVGSWIRTALCVLLVLTFAVRSQAVLDVQDQQAALGCEEGFTVSPPGS